MPASFAQQQSGDPLYFLVATYPPELGDYCIAYAPAGSGVPSPVSLADTWNKYPGVYLFLGHTPTNQTAFASGLANLLANPAYPNATFIWIANPNDPWPQWVATPICVQDGAVSQLGQWMIRNLSLFVGGTCPVALNSAGDGFTVTAPSEGYLYLTAMNGSATLTGITTPLTISFGVLPGCLSFNLTLNNSGPTPDFDRLATGMCYFADNPSQPGSGQLTSWRYPLFDPSDPNAASLQTSVSIDPLNPIDPSRTWFALVPAGQTSGPTLTSFYVTNMGYRLSLTPAFPNGSDPSLLPRFTLAIRATNTNPLSSDPYYLTPAGMFNVGVVVTKAPATGADPVQRIVCGTSGIEYLGLMASGGNVMYFFPGQAAYAASFNNSSSSTTGLNPTAQTSWVYLTGAASTGLNYYAQPLGSAFYEAVQGTNTEDFASFLEICAGILPGTITTSGQSVTMFPMVPYAGIQDTDYADYLGLELQVLNPVRRAVIYGIATAPASPITGTLPVFAGTPQGLLAEFSKGSGQSPDLTFTLAQSTDNKGNVYTLQFDAVDDDLLAGFQSNQLFLVISDQSMLTKHCKLFGPNLTISTPDAGDWTFNVFGDWTQHGTILIFKFGDKPLGELVNDTTTWINAADYNQTVANTQSAMQQIIQNATQPDPNNPANRIPIDPDFDYFVDTVVNSGEWTGMLVLNCNVPLNGLPDQIAGLAAGINTSLFQAHHLGVNITPLTITTSDSQNQMALSGNSSLFGLIYYNDPANLVYNGNPYQFKVLSLKVLFANSTVTNFSSQIEINVSQLFAEGAGSPDSGYGLNNLVLNGTYQNQGGTGAYQFLSNGITLFTIDGKSLDSVEITQAQFITVVPPDQVQTGQQAESSFLLWGMMKFNALTGFDLFSFGDSSDGQTQGGLAFSNLSIDMYYDADPPPNQPPPPQQFVFDANHIAFDLSGSKARTGSLYNQFPLTLSGFVQAAGDKTPNAVGYLTVDAPIGQSSLTVPWFGLVMQLNLGSPGALASGGFTASLLAAWGPNQYSPSVALGLQLPGLGGSKLELAIESVVKLKIQKIKFMVDSKGSYVLLLNNISLNLLLLTFPPNGQTSAYLFGDVNGTNNTTLAWYAGYVENPKKQQQQQLALPPGGKS